MPKWKVIGQRAFLGNEPGEEFYAELEPAMAERALARRSIELVGKGMPKLDKKNVSAPSEKPAEPAADLGPEPETEDQ